MEDKLTDQHVTAFGALSFVQVIAGAEMGGPIDSIMSAVAFGIHAAIADPATASKFAAGLDETFKSQYGKASGDLKPIEFIEALRLDYANVGR